MVTHAGAPELMRATRALARLLRDRAHADLRTVLNHAEHRELVWLDDGLPEGVAPPTMRRDGILLALDHQPASSPPPPPGALRGLLGPPPEDELSGPPPLLPEADAAARDRYLDWISEWRRWAEREREADGYRALYRQLARIAGKISQQDDVYELVLGVGLLSWRAPASAVRAAPRSGRRGVSLDRGPEQLRVRRHLITHPVEAHVDQRTARVTVRLAPGGQARFEDVDFLPGADDYAGGHTSRYAGRLAGTSQHPMAEEVAALLARWELPGGEAVPFSRSWTRPSEATARPQITFAPALILRERDGRGLADFYDRLLVGLDAPESAVPLGVAQLLAPGSTPVQGKQPAVQDGDGPLFPLPVNREQRSVLDALRRESAVVLQGPPGTGKTHTIANLITELLASGLRVLVTAQKSQALQVLRNLLPPQLRELCVLLADPRLGGAGELERSLVSLAERAAETDTEVLRASIDRLTERRRTLLGRRSATMAKLRELREAETTPHPPVAPGYPGSLPQIVEDVQRERSRLSWIGRLPRGAPSAPPLDREQAAELRRLLGELDGETLPRGAGERRGMPLPGSRDLPSAAEVEELVHAAESVPRRELRLPADAPHGMELLNPPVVADLRLLCDEVAQAAAELGLPGELSGWPEDAWPSRALADLAAGRAVNQWNRVAAGVTDARSMLAAVRSLTSRLVEVPRLTPAETADMLRDGTMLRDAMTRGYRLRPGVLASSVQRNARPLLDSCTVDGHQPADAAELDDVLAVLRAQVTADQLVERWARAGVRQPFAPGAGATQSLRALLEELVERGVALATVQGLVRTLERARALLEAQGARMEIASAQDFDRLRRCVAILERRVEVATARDRLAAAEQRVRRVTDLDRPARELVAARSAIRDRDVAGYRWALRALDAAQGRQRHRQLAEELLTRLREAHPELAERLLATPGDPLWDERLADLDEAWAWARARDFCERARTPGAEEHLQAELAEIDQRMPSVVADLAAELAWLRCLRGMTAEQRRGLQAYGTHVAAYRRSGGGQAARHRQAERAALEAARGALPGWIMPIAQVVESVPAEPDSFDVVIVDEASQVGVESLFLLALAPRVIVVGDDRQCAPHHLSLRGAEEFAARLDTELSDLPAPIRDLFAPDANLYDILSSRGEAIRLREHFRCMPEIINFSSAEFYDGRLEPLRQFGADRLDPLRVIRVPGAGVEGRGPTFRNPEEAQRIVDALSEMLADPAYDRRTFGVIVLQGAGQVALLDELISAQIDPVVREQRRIRVGFPPDFQGDERDVVLLSLTVVEPQRTMGGEAWERRAVNVAASRARDQMWLFTSVPPGWLARRDLRASLIGYMENPPPAIPPRDDLQDVNRTIAHPAFDSLFEQRVMLDLTERGYTVVPQFPAGDTRIDLVVIGDRTRLAVECDGRTWYRDTDQADRELEREQQLKRVGWAFARVRESAYLMDPERAMRPVFEALTARGIEPRAERWPVRPVRSRWQPTGVGIPRPVDTVDPGAEPQAGVSTRVPYGGDLADPSEVDDPDLDSGPVHRRHH